MISITKCESPIEELFYTALSEVEAKVRGLGFDLDQQYEVAPYVLYFVFISKDGHKVCVELDGHEFHHKTAEQVGQGCRRDRALLLNGWRVVHFTGREVSVAASKCVSETLLHLQHEKPPSDGQTKLAEATAKAMIRIAKKSSEMIVKREIEHEERMKSEKLLMSHLSRRK